ncbi:MAG: trigger factor [Pseudorhodoplanes sp.]
MQVTETKTDGLQREYQVVVPVTELAERVDARLEQLKNQVQIKGFRPGKVPVAHLKRIYGRSAMAEAIEAAVRETNAKIVQDNSFRLAMEPKVTLPEEQGAVDSVITGKADLSYTVAMEILPAIKLADFKTLSIEKPVAEVTDADVDEGIKRIAEQNRPFAAKGEGAKAENGDRVVVSFEGSIDGAPFEGGKGEDIPVQLGAGSFIPGFEEQLVGIAAGETRTVAVTFPENYAAPALAGKAASFEVTAKAVEAPGETKIDEDFAKSLGLDSLDKLKSAIRERLERDYAAASRAKMKRALLDQLDETHKFEVSPTLLEQEFEGLWNSTNAELKAQGRTFADEGTTEEAARADYRKIADRRVRLGLVLAEIGEKNNIQVTDEEVNRALVERLRQFPGQEQQVYDLYRKNPNAMANLRAPIFEDKVIDFLLELAKVTEKKVSREDLYKQDEEDKAA